MHAEITVLTNGVAVISEHLPGRQSVALSLSLGNGSRDQLEEENGFAHLLEHMVFKGSLLRDADALNAAMEALGGTINAFTDREMTVFHGTMLAEDAGAGFALLEEMLMRPRFAHADLRLEKQVVAQEAAMAAEDIEDWVQERVLRELWGDHPLAWSVLGSARCIRQASRRRLVAYHERVLRESRLAVVGVGMVDHDTLCRWAEGAFGDISPQPRGADQPPTFRTGRRLVHRPQAQQAHLVWAAQACSVADPAYYAYAVANLILGGGTASHLFRELRERRGLAYQVFSHLEALRDAGEWMIYVATPARSRDETAVAMTEVLHRLMESGPEAEELAGAKRSLRVQILLGQEDVETRMARLGRQWLYLDRCIAVEESLQRLTAVDAAAVTAVLSKAWGQRFELSCLPG